MWRQKADSGLRLVVVLLGRAMKRAEVEEGKA